jgi:hypothetical protein
MGERAYVTSLRCMALSRESLIVGANGRGAWPPGRTPSRPGMSRGIEADVGVLNGNRHGMGCAAAKVCMMRPARQQQDRVIASRILRRNCAEWRLSWTG